MAGAQFDRRVSDGLLRSLSVGELHFLTEEVLADRISLDLQLHHRPGSSVSSALFYCGLTKVLTVEHSGKGVRFLAATSHRESGGFDDTWSEWFPLDAVVSASGPILEYVRQARAGVAPRWTEREGRVHQLLAAELDGRIRVLTREAVLAFPNRDARAATIANASGQVPSLLSDVSTVARGAEADLLGVAGGRLWVIEAKPADASVVDLADSPAQALLYGALFAEWAVNTPIALEVLAGMSAQRAQIGLNPPAVNPGHELSPGFRVVPVVIIGPGPIATAALDRMQGALDLIEDAPTVSEVLDPLEVWRLDDAGLLSPLDMDAERAAGHVAETTNPFENQARKAAAEWKATSAVLPEPARVSSPYKGKGLYPFCLPADLTNLNLLPDAQASSLSRFEAAGIPWHDGVDGGPSPHLLSSQVQCANTLAPHLNDPNALVTMFRDVLPIAEVLPFGADAQSPFDATDYVVFEWIGLQDHLGEWNGKPGRRGAHNTSADAALRYRNHRGQIEVALIEWKYRENYTAAELSGGAAKNATREMRYRHMVEDRDGPIRSGVLDFDDFLTEPLYQLMRQQLMAWRMEQARELDADIVRVVYCAPSANRALWDRMLRPAWERELARGVVATPGPLLSLWTRLLRRPDRFVYFDTARLLEPQMPTSSEWRARYGHLVVGAQRVKAGDADLVAAIDRARMILERVAGDGGVLEQLAALVGEYPGQLPPAITQSLANRIADIAEQTRQLRSNDVFEALEAFRSDGKRDEVEPE